MTMKVQCRRCGYILDPFTQKQMIGFILKNGDAVNFCEDCITDLGRCKNDEEKAEFFRELGIIDD